MSALTFTSVQPLTRAVRRASPLAGSFSDLPSTVRIGLA